MWGDYKMNKYARFWLKWIIRLSLLCICVVRALYIRWNKFPSGELKLGLNVVIFSGFDQSFTDLPPIEAILYG